MAPRWPANPGIIDFNVEMGNFCLEKLEQQQ
jgi:hypothetical protein